MEFICIATHMCQCDTLLQLLLYTLIIIGSFISCFGTERSHRTMKPPRCFPAYKPSKQWNTTKLAQ